MRTEYFFAKCSYLSSLSFKIAKQIDHQNDSCENTKYKSCCQPWLPEHNFFQYTRLSIVRIIGIMKTSSEINQLYKPLASDLQPLFLID